MAIGIVTVTGFPAALTYHIPGFVKIDEMRQIGDNGLCEFVIVYDDTKLDEVSEVLLSGDYYPMRPNALDIRLGTVHLANGSRFYVYWYARPVPQPDSDGISVMVVADTMDRLDFYVPGFLRVDHFRQLADERLELHIVYDPKRTNEIHHLKFRSDYNPDPTPSPMTVGIGNRKGGESFYVRYEDTIVTTAKAG
ncbi:hypothetical protein [Nocardia pseudobrasiliensis]|uniref:Uncharacterized protein n=1 Tax=Nocardia pseudobrasiliensis TaxID=45979 RepID=A0A370I4Y7_9NOCA|nr:hypothetical protein [Nocardia pseudobrasiliensis]RDI65782.1 hypothetical protein DFR76_10597 [Nocardia pseudobrasiliensis]